MADINWSENIDESRNKADKMTIGHQIAVSIACLAAVVSLVAIIYSERVDALKKTRE